MAAVANVAINVDARQPVSAFQRIKSAAKKLQDQIDKINITNKRLSSSFEKMGNRGINTLRDLEQNTRKLAKATGGLRGALGKAAIAYLAVKSAQEGIQRIESERRIKLLAASYGEVAQLQQAAAATAKKFNLSQTEANQSLADTYARLRPLGVSLADITSTFNGFQTAAILGGASTIEASNAFRQLAQALGSGALRGDEFRSVAEQAPLVLKAISDETGLAAGQLKDFAAEGALTSDIVIKALKRIESEGAANLEEALDGPAAAIKDFQNAAQDVQVALTTAVIPQMSGAFRDLADIIRDLEPAINFIGELLGGLAKAAKGVIESVRFGGEAVKARRQAQASAGKQTQAKFGAVGGIFSGERNKFFEETYEKELNRRMAFVRGAVFGQLPASVNNVATPTGTSPISLKPSRSAGRSGRAGIDRTQQRIDAGNQIEQQLRRQIELRSATSDLDRELLEINYELQDTLARINSSAEDSQKAQLNNLAAINAQAERMQTVQESFASFFKQSQEQSIQFAEAQGEFATFFKEETQQVNLLNEALQGTGQILGNSLMSVFDGLINKSTDFNDVLRNTLSQIGGLLMNAGLNMMAGPQGSGGILSFLGFGTRAGGGPVNANSPYIVGERGPELFVPGASGGITNNHEMQSMMSKQRSSSPSMNFTFETTNIGGTEYVSREQLDAAMAVTRKQAANDGARRGMSMTLDKMQQSPATRRRVGLS